MRAIISVILANILAIGMDACLRSFFHINITNQLWLCLNGAWVLILLFWKN